MSVARKQEARYLRATVAYDGTDFCGFQVQVAQRTVQGTLEDALATITQETVRVIGAGRTDSGVHAWGQVVAFRTGWRHSLDDLHQAWNAVLPDDVSVRCLEDAEEGFHPRFDAQSRVYRYTIWGHPVRNPLLRRTALWIAKVLDVPAMNQASHLLVGEHDFATFGSPPQGENTLRRVVRAAWTQEESMLYLDIEGNAFLYRMVRSIVGTLLLVGTGALSVEQFASLFTAADRSQAGPTGPAHGLCLMAVKY
ncbi:MAG: tRNA pseudouridine(38-40) synthase TruA [Chloroflexi bacterium]|nr:tRNA pseudouridine(38-40) synthase TruA [Chloroflexota bacterium]